MFYYRQRFHALLRRAELIPEANITRYGIHKKGPDLKSRLDFREFLGNDAFQSGTSD